ncbi:hypothetical protein [Streptomyces sp. NPDC060194]|uniref:hypothetical protein n=1 Tax=Streptomyces sp. NPDC060194 TaxID=3347069 RepID=UPI00364798C8
MGIESDRLVYDYLSRVGDLAQTSLPSGERARLVAELRSRIDSGRSARGADTPAAVRRMLHRIGTPDEVVAAHVPAPERGTEAPRESPPEGAPSPQPAERPSVPQQRGVADPAAPAAPTDWWRVDRGELGGEVPGFVGGVEIPELRGERPRADGDAGPPAAGAGTGAAAAKAAVPRRRLFRRAAAVPAPVPAPAVVAVPARTGPANPLLLLAAVLLVAGAVLGSLLPLALGWGLVYLSRRLSRTEAKAAVLGIPAASALAGAVWLWGRTEGRWGDRLPADGLGAALTEAWPWALRGAALASALFVLWRSQRVRG